MLTKDDEDGDDVDNDSNNNAVPDIIFESFRNGKRDLWWLQSADCGWCT